VLLWSWVQSHRWWCVAFFALLMLSSAGGTCWAVFFRTVATPVSLREALSQYRRHQGTGSSQRGGVLSPGVFSYATSGGESLSLPGVSRSFPARSNMVVNGAAGSCGAVDWVPIVQHSETTTVCPSMDHSLAISNLVTFEQISGSTTTTVIDCPPTAYLVPPIAAPGVRWTATCHQLKPAQDVAMNGQVVGAIPIEVSGRSINTVHVRMTLVFNGIDQGPSTTDFWISTTRGVVVHEQELATVTQSGVHYKEEMSTLLTSLTPAG